MSRLSFLAGLGLALLLASGVLAKEYEIRLTRPVVVGQRYRVTIAATRQSKSIATINGQEQPAEEQTLTVNFAGVVEVLQISRKGTPLIEEYAVEKCTLTTRGKTTELVKPGAVISVHANYDGPIVEVVGDDVTDDDLANIGELFSLNATEITDDDIFGSSKPRGPGESWAMNTANAQKLAKTAGVTMEDVTGKITFTGMKSHLGANCLEMTSTWSVGKMIPPDDTLPPKFTVSRSNFKATTWGLYPEDNISLPMHEKVTEDMQRVLTGTNANRQKIVAATAGRRIREIKRSPLTVEKVPQVGGAKTRPKG